MDNPIENPSDCAKYEYLLFVSTHYYNRDYGVDDFEHRVFGYKTKEDVSEHVKRIMNYPDVKYSVIENHKIVNLSIKTVIEF